MKNMKNRKALLALSALCLALTANADEWIRINQLGYLPQSVKVAVFMSEEAVDLHEYSLIDDYTGQVVETFHAPSPPAAMAICSLPIGSTSASSPARAPIA